MNKKTKTEATDRRVTEDKRLTEAELNEIVGGVQATSAESKKTSRGTMTFNIDVTQW